MFLSMKNLIVLSIFFLLVTSCQQFHFLESSRPTIFSSAIRLDTRSAQAQGKKFAIASQGIYATNAAKKIFLAGGNAVDAAVAASFVLAVERPHSTGLGGGGFMLFREASTQKIYAIDFRERAPIGAHEKMYLAPDATPISSLSINGIKATAVPGLVAGLLEIHQKFGRLKRDEVMADAISLAEKGFAIYPSFANALKIKREELAKDPEARKLFLDKNLNPLPEGFLFVQSDLASTLKKISQEGSQAFYAGDIMKQFVSFSQHSKGLLSQSDFREYQVKWRHALRGRYNGLEIYSMPPPSSGGVHVIEFLNILEHDHLREKKFLSSEAIHLATSALQIAFADRARYLGDPDFVKVPTEELISKDYARRRRKDILSDRARASSEILAGEFLPNEHFETTHLSIMDAEGNAVSTTQTINGYMGASIVVPHTGIVMNNEMDDFAAAVGASNLFGAIGGSANMIAPKKTPLSSMSPTIILENNTPILTLGAPGGTRIISCVAQTILNYLEFKLPLYDSIASIRYHHQWQPDVIDIDPPGPGPKELNSLLKMGHKVNLKPLICNVMAVAKEQGILKAVADPRDIGTSAAQ